MRPSFTTGLVGVLLMFVLVKAQVAALTHGFQFRLVPGFWRVVQMRGREHDLAFRPLRRVAI